MQVDRLDGSGEAYADAVAIRDEVALATKVLKSVLGASVRGAYRARGEPIWSVWRADEDIERAVRGAFGVRRRGDDQGAGAASGGGGGGGAHASPST